MQHKKKHKKTSNLFCIQLYSIRSLHVVVKFICDVQNKILLEERVIIYKLLYNYRVEKR